MSNEPNQQRPLERRVRPHDGAIERDHNGEWYHPGIPWEDYPDEHDMTPHLKALGFDVRRVDLDDLGESPEPPLGDGWFLASIFDSEDGPGSCWLRPNG